MSTDGPAVENAMLVSGIDGERRSGPHAPRRRSDLAGHGRSGEARDPTVRTPYPRDDFTPRERDVLDLLARGLVAKEIAVELGITSETARSYLKAILAKLGVHTQLQAVLEAAERRLLGADHPLTCNCQAGDRATPPRGAAHARRARGERASTSDFPGGAERNEVPPR